MVDGKMRHRITVQSREGGPARYLIDRGTNSVGLGEY